MDEDDDGITLDEGMKVVDADGDALGEIAVVLVEEENEETGFLIVRGADAERLVPFEVINGEQDGALVLDIEPEEFTGLPLVPSSRDPTGEEIEQAYRLLGLTDDDG